MPEEITGESVEEEFFKSYPVKGIAKVILFSPNHSKTLSTVTIPEIQNVIKLWVNEFEEIKSNTWIK